MNSRLYSSSSRLYTSLCIIIYHHIWSLLSPLSILWIQVSRQRQSTLVKPLSRSQNSPTLLSGQDNSTLSSPYLGLQSSPTLSSFQLFQNRCRHIYTSGPIVLGNLQRLIPSSLTLLVSDLCHLVSTPWPILITRLITTQGRRSGCVQSTGCSSPLSDVQRWSSVMP